MTLLITLRKVLINVKDAPYTFKFDEMITARTKKTVLCLLAILVACKEQNYQC